MNFTENHLNLLRNVLLFTLHPSVLARNAGKDPTLTVLRNLGAAPGFGVDHLSTSELEKKVASDLFKISRKIDSQNGKFEYQPLNKLYYLFLTKIKCKLSHTDDVICTFAI